MHGSPRGRSHSWATSLPQTLPSQGAIPSSQRNSVRAWKSNAVPTHYTILSCSVWGMPETGFHLIGLLPSSSKWSPSNILSWLYIFQIHFYISNNVLAFFAPRFRFWKKKCIHLSFPSIDFHVKAALCLPLIHAQQGKRMTINETATPLLKKQKFTDGSYVPNPPKQGDGRGWLVQLIINVLI